MGQDGAADSRPPGVAVHFPLRMAYEIASMTMPSVDLADLLSGETLLKANRRSSETAADRPGGFRVVERT
eukprot:6930838-Pyramimonas_sp.AAC.1